jgi:FlaG/FlaF family flagellin (archaellin)
MVAIVVVLGAVISVTALGMANDIPSPAPQVSFDYSADYTNGDVIITKTGGGTLNGDQLRFSGAALEKTSYGGITEWAGKDVKSGDPAAVHVARGETLKLIWQSPNGGNTAIIAEYDVPNDLGPTASIGSVETRYSTHNDDGDLTVKNIQFSQVQDNNVYVVVEAERYSDNKIFSNSGGDLDMELNPGSGVPYLGNGDPVTVTVYETESKSNVLTTVTVPA